MADASPYKSNSGVKLAQDYHTPVCATIVIALLVAMPFLCNLGATYSWSYLKFFALQTVALLAWSRMLTARPARIEVTSAASGIAFPITLLLVWAAVSAAWSPHPWATVRPLIELTYMAAATIGLASLFASPGVRHRFVPIYGAAAAGACIVYIICYTLADTHMRVYPFENPNVAAAFGIVPMAVGTAYLLAALKRRVFAGAWISGTIVMCVCGAAIAVSKSASGLASGIGAILMVIFFSLSERSRLAALGFLTVLGIACTLWLVLVPDLWPELWNMWLRHQLGVRPALWSGALELVGERPLSGFGLGTFFIEYARVHPIEYAAHQYATNTVDKAHCLPLHIAVELGVVGLVITIWLVVSAFRRALRAMHGATGKDAILLQGLICGAAGMLAQGLVSESIHQPESTVHLVLALALVAGISSGTPQQPRTSALAFKKGWAAALLCSFAAIYMMLTAVKPLCGQVHLRRAEHTPRSQWTRRARLFGDAANMSWPWEQPIRRIWPALWNSLPNIHWPTLWTLQARLKLAQVYAEAGRFEDALKEAEAVDRFAPNLADVRLMASGLYLELGRIEDATRAIISYCEKDPFDRRAYEQWAAVLDLAIYTGRPLAAQPQKAIDFLHIAKRLNPPRLRAGNAETLMQPFLRAIKTNKLNQDRSSN